MRRIVPFVAAVAAVCAFATPAAAKRVKPAALVAGCTVTARDAAAPTWLHIEAPNGDAGQLYQFVVTQPGGGVTGDLRYPDDDGVVRDDAMSAVFPGTYTVTVGPINGAVESSCTVDVP